MNYDVANMKYWKEYKQATDEKIPVYRYEFREESELSVQEKIEVIDSEKEGFASLILILAKEFADDLENGIIKTEVRYCGISPKTVSMKAWLKRKNKERHFGTLISTDYHIGQIHIGDGDNRYIQYLAQSEESRVEFVNAVFAKVLKNRALRERNYFLEHDEYSVLQKTVSEHLLLRALNFPHIISSRDGLLIGTFESNRKATLEDLKAILAKLKELEKMADKISSELKEQFKESE